MEEEAHLGEQVSTRRRSASFSDDFSVQRTNDDAAQCKAAAVHLGYWQDEFIHDFVPLSDDAGAAGAVVPHRDPEISLGYWARVAAVLHYAKEFVDKHGKNAQIVNFGAGFDTLYWRLKTSGKSFARFVDVDFSSVTAKKLKAIARTEKLKNVIGEYKEEQHSDIHGSDYHLVGADLRIWNELYGKLKAAEVDPLAPTLCIAECVLVYMSTDRSTSLLAHIAQLFEHTEFINYEQVGVGDRFGQVMEKNLKQRGISLPGLPACTDLRTQELRFTDAGWQSARAIDMNGIYTDLLPAAERKRVEAIEMLDEKELLVQLLSHYSITFAVNDKTKKLTPVSK